MAGPRNPYSEKKSDRDGVAFREVSKMKVAFRVDASFEIGTGHFMRCLTLADHLSTIGFTVLFLCRHLPTHLRHALITRRFPLIDLSVSSGPPPGPDETSPLAHASWLGASQSTDAEACKLVLHEENVDWLVVDHYALDKCWENALRSVVRRLMAIDDLADRDHDCDVLLDQNFYPDIGKRYAGRVSDSCVMLLGPRFSLLRDEFRTWRTRANVRSAGVCRLLVFLGGVDATNFTGRILVAIHKLAFQRVLVDVVVGAQHPCLIEIRTLCAEQGFVLHVQSSNMAELMANADLAIGATGATSWERCCLGLPSVTVSLAENQIDIASGLEMTGASVYLGHGASVDFDRVCERLSALIERPDEIKAMSERAFALVDGDGVIRVGQVLMG